MANEQLTTPDGRYIVVRDRLWRRSDPTLATNEREALVAKLMDGRRAVARALRLEKQIGLSDARAQVNAAKIALGERGPVWWTDGSPDLNRHLVRNTPYSAWYDQMKEQS